MYSTSYRRCCDPLPPPPIPAPLLARGYVPPPGRPRPLMPAGRSGQTNDLSEFRVFGLMSGEYVLAASVQPQSPFQTASTEPTTEHSRHRPARPVAHRCARSSASGCWAAVYLSPSGLPTMRRRIASFRRLAFVSSCLADSIQPMYRRRCEGASPSKYRRAAGCFLSAAWMCRGVVPGIWNRGGRGPWLRSVGARLIPPGFNLPLAFRAA